MTAKAHSADELHDLFFERVNAHDLEGLIDLFEPDCSFTDLEDNRLAGVEALRTFLGGFLEVCREIHTTVHKTCTYGDKVALTSNRWEAVLAFPDGSTGSATGTSAEVSHRRPDGTWRYVIDEPIFDHRQTNY